MQLCWIGIAAQLPLGNWNAQSSASFNPLEGSFRDSGWPRLFFNFETNNFIPSRARLTTILWEPSSGWWFLPPPPPPSTDILTLTMRGLLAPHHTHTAWQRVVSSPAGAVGPFQLAQLR